MSTSKSSRSEKKETKRPAIRKWGLVLLTILLSAVWWFPKVSSPAPRHSDVAGSASESTHSLAGRIDFLRNRPRSVPSDQPRTVPQGSFEHVFDKAPGVNRFLLSHGRDAKFVPDSDAPSGMDLWIQNENGEERLVDQSVYRARFSPDGTKIAYATSECVMHIEDLQGRQLAKIDRAYEPSWKPDGSGVVFAQVPNDRDIHLPGVLHISTLDLATGEVQQLTDGKWDDSHPEYSPSGDSVIFVSGGRSGFASFWKVSPGSEPEQLTNPGAEAVDEKFVPTPYNRTLWSQDKRWFVYDFKNGDREEIWGLEFAPDGKLKQTQLLAAGLDPQLRDDGRTIVFSKREGETVETFAYQLP